MRRGLGEVRRSSKKVSTESEVLEIYFKLKSVDISWGRSREIKGKLGEVM